MVRNTQILVAANTCQPVTWSAAGWAMFYASVNGDTGTGFGYQGFSTAFNKLAALGGTATVIANAGDRLSVQVYQESGSTMSPLSLSSNNWVTIRFVRPYP